MQSARTAARLVLSRCARCDPAPVSVQAKRSTETGAARGPQSHAQRGFAGLTHRVKTREPARQQPRTVDEDAPSSGWAARLTSTSRPKDCYKKWSIKRNAVAL